MLVASSTEATPEALIGAALGRVRLEHAMVAARLVETERERDRWRGEAEALREPGGRRRLEATTRALEEQVAECLRLEAENARLLRRVAELEVQVGVRGGADLAALRRRVVELEGQLAERTAELHEARRAGKRSAAPHRRRHAKADPKRPGRKPGHPGSWRQPHAQPDETIDVPLECCPDCQGELCRRQTHTNDVDELPPIRARRIRYINQSGYCRRCRKRARSRHPDQPSTAGGAAGVALGPNALALAITLKIRHSVAMRRVAELFCVAFGMRFTAGGLAQALQRIGRRLDATYQALCAALRVARAVFADETGWRIVRANAWLWVICSREVTVYVVDARKHHDVPLRVLGESFAGFIHHDGARTYDALPYRSHQTCIPHILRDLDELAEEKTRGAVRWPRAVAALLRDAMELRRTQGAQMPEHPERADDAAGQIETRLDRLLFADLTDPENRRMQRRLLRNRDMLFPFLYFDEAEPTNNRAERQLRLMIAGRKVGAGNRSEAGALAHQILASVVATSRQQQHNELEILAEAIRNPRGHLIERLIPALPPDVGALGATGPPP